MLRRLFVKEAFEHIEEELKAIYKIFGIEEQKLKTKKQVATYSKSYDYTVEGTIRNHRFVLNLYQNPLKEETKKQQLELIIQCENPNWTTLVLQKKTIAKSDHKKTLDIEPIHQLKNVNLDKLILASNNNECLEELFDIAMGEKVTILNKIKFSSFVLERKRLYIKTAWLPDTFSKRQALIQLLDFAINLVEKIDGQE
ncbi:hypothetical protein [Aureispira sp. CCB-QB1]|uniref:hypothetical protein n=1 Tax=Aureispira sp. CCB-QB1 TaxID=1313421 RepID=UPI0006970445|nr:hypothetical protein [Aureispira sp. CCB-QB1]